MPRLTTKLKPVHSDLSEFDPLFLFGAGCPSSGGGDGDPSSRVCLNPKLKVDGVVGDEDPDNWSNYASMVTMWVAMLGIIVGTNMLAACCCCMCLTCSRCPCHRHLMETPNPRDMESKRALVCSRYGLVVLFIVFTSIVLLIAQVAGNSGLTTAQNNLITKDTHNLALLVREMPRSVKDAALPTLVKSVRELVVRANRTVGKNVDVMGLQTGLNCAQAMDKVGKGLAALLIDLHPKMQEAVDELPMKTDLDNIVAITTDTSAVLEGLKDKKLTAAADSIGIVQTLVTSIAKSSVEISGWLQGLSDAASQFNLAVDSEVSVSAADVADVKTKVQAWLTDSANDVKRQTAVDKVALIKAKMNSMPALTPSEDANNCFKASCGGAPAADDAWTKMSEDVQAFKVAFADWPTQQVVEKPFKDFQDLNTRIRDEIPTIETVMTSWNKFAEVVPCMRPQIDEIFKMTSDVRISMSCLAASAGALPMAIAKLLGPAVADQLAQMKDGLVLANKTIWEKTADFGNMDGLLGALPPCGDASLALNVSEVKSQITEYLASVNMQPILDKLAQVGTAKDQISTAMPDVEALKESQRQASDMVTKMKESTQTLRTTTSPNYEQYFKDVDKLNAWFAALTTSLVAKDTTKVQQTVTSYDDSPPTRPTPKLQKVSADADALLTAAKNNQASLDTAKTKLADIPDLKRYIKDTDTSKSPLSAISPKLKGLDDFYLKKDTFLDALKNAADMIKNEMGKFPSEQLVTAKGYLDNWVDFSQGSKEEKGTLAAMEQDLSDDELRKSLTLDGLAATLVRVVEVFEQTATKFGMNGTMMSAADFKKTEAVKVIELIEGKDNMLGDIHYVTMLLSQGMDLPVKFLKDSDIVGAKEPLVKGYFGSDGEYVAAFPGQEDATMCVTQVCLQNTIRALNTQMSMLLTTPPSTGPLTRQSLFIMLLIPPLLVMLVACCALKVKSCGCCLAFSAMLCIGYLGPFVTPFTAFTMILRDGCDGADMLLVSEAKASFAAKCPDPLACQVDVTKFLMLGNSTGGNASIVLPNATLTFDAAPLYMALIEGHEGVLHKVMTKTAADVKRMMKTVAIAKLEVMSANLTEELRQELQLELVAADVALAAEQFLVGLAGVVDGSSNGILKALEPLHTGACCDVIGSLHGFFYYLFLIIWAMSCCAVPGGLMIAKGRGPGEFYQEQNWSEPGSARGYQIWGRQSKYVPTAEARPMTQWRTDEFELQNYGEPVGSGQTY